MWFHYTEKKPPKLINHLQNKLVLKLCTLPSVFTLQVIIPGVLPCSCFLVALRTWILNPLMYQRISRRTWQHKEKGFSVRVETPSSVSNDQKMSPLNWFVRCRTRCSKNKKWCCLVKNLATEAQTIFSDRQNPRQRSRGLDQVKLNCNRGLFQMKVRFSSIQKLDFFVVCAGKEREREREGQTDRQEEIERKSLTTCRPTKEKLIVCKIRGGAMWGGGGMSGGFEAILLRTLSHWKSCALYFWKSGVIWKLDRSSPPRSPGNRTSSVWNTFTTIVGIDLVPAENKMLTCWKSETASFFFFLCG